MRSGITPNVSVVMPFWNRSELVSNAIGSIIDQTYRQWELIIVNDGSEPSHRAQLEKILEGFNDERIRVVDRPHEGIVAARNEGNKEAKAEILTMQDSDDLSMPDRIEKSLEEIGKADILYHGMYKNMWDEHTKRIVRIYVPARKANRDKLVRGQYIPSCPFYRKKVWEKKPFRNEARYSFDYMMYLDWFFSGFWMQNLNIGLYEYVRQQGSASIMFENQGLRKESMEAIKKIVRQEYQEEVYAE